MKKNIVLVALAALTSVFAFAGNGKGTKSFAVNTQKSTFNWLAKKVTGQHSGVATFSNGTVLVKNNMLAGATIEVDMNSIDATDLTGEWHDKLVGHLKSEDFFNVAKFGKASLVITRIKPIKGAKTGENNYTITANLTIKGITKEVSFPAMVSITETGVSAVASFDIDRTLYDIKYGSGKFFEGLGDKMINDTFNIKVNIVAGN